MSNKNTFTNLNFDQIPTSDEFKNIKVKPKNRIINALTLISIATIGISLGVILAYLLYIYC